LRPEATLNENKQVLYLDIGINYILKII